MPTFAKATTLLTTEASELQLELSAHAYKAKLQVEMKTRGEPTQVRRSKTLISMGYDAATPTAPDVSTVLSPAVPEQALHEGIVTEAPSVPSPDVEGPAVEHPHAPINWELLQYHLRTVSVYDVTAEFNDIMMSCTSPCLTFAPRRTWRFRACSLQTPCCSFRGWAEPFHVTLLMKWLLIPVWLNLLSDDS